MNSKKGPTNSAVIAMSESEVALVSKEFFVDGMQLPVRVYMEFSPGHYILVGKKGEKTNFTSLHSFKNENTSVYVRSEDYNDLMNHMTELTGKIVSNKIMPDATKVKFLSGLTSHALESLGEAGITSAAQVEKVANYVMKMSENFKDFGQVIDLLAGLPDDQSKHAMAACFVSLMIADEMKLTHQTALDKLAMGALLHDVGLKYVPESIMSKPKHLWSPEENLIFESHSVKGAEMLRDLKDISNDILFIVAEHHENSLGTGFPRKLRDVKISPLGRIVGLATCFSELLFARVQGSKNYTPDQALEYVQDILGQPFNKQVFSALKNIVNKKYILDRVNKVS